MAERTPSGGIGHPVELPVGGLRGLPVGVLLGLALVTVALWGPGALAAGVIGEIAPGQGGSAPSQAGSASGQAATASAPVGLSPERISELASMIHNDCGACHGGRLRGGLGTSLVPEALGRKTAEELAHVIYNGIPDTAMPPWSRFLTREEALWIAQQLMKGPADVRR